MKTHLNLIPTSTQRRHAARRLVRQWSTAVAMAGVLCGLVLALEWGRLFTARQDLMALRKEYAPIAELVQEQWQFVEEIGKLRQREKLSIGLSQELPALALLGPIVEATQQEGLPVYLRRLTYGTTGSNRRGASVRRRLHLEGTSTHGVAIAGFAQTLRESGVFESVSIGSTKPYGGKESLMRSFEIECYF